MATLFPGAIDQLVNPVPSNPLNNPSHSAQHANANDAIEAIEGYLGVASSTDPATITGRVVALEAGGAAGTVTGVGATAPVTSTGGTAPVIGMPKASATVDGYLDNADWSLFNGKQAPATTLAGYGITNAYTKTESDANYPTKAGTGASGSWAISITGNANTASVASIANWAKAVEDLNNAANDIKQWIGTQAQYDALGTWDAATFYTITDAPSDGGTADALPLAGGTMTGPINWAVNGQAALLNIIADPLSPTGDVFNVESDAGVRVKGPYVVLDTTNLQMTMPGAQLNAALTVAAIDAYGVVSLGYTALPPPSYSVLDTTNAPVLIKAAGVAPPTAWVSLGLSVTLAQDIAAGTGNVGFEGIFVNDTNRLGTVEFGLRVNGATVNARDIVTQISPNFNQTVGMSLPLINAYTNGDLLELMARVTTNDNNAFQLTMANSDTDLGAMRIYTTPSSGSGTGGAVNSVGGVAPIVSSGGTDPQISIPAATTTVNGYLSAANFNTFNNKADKATSLAGYGITNAYTKTETDGLLAGKADDATSLAGYGITDAYTKTQSDANYPTKTGGGASGSWAINITGTSASATSAVTATTALGVDDLNSTATVKQWVGLQAEYDALGSWDATTFYNITDAETPSIPGGGTTVAWDDVTGKPSTFPPSAHTHAIADVTNLQTSLDGKAPTSHTHTTAQVTGLDTALAGKAPLGGAGTSGTWPISVTGNAGTASTATAVNDNGAGATMKFWYGTEAEFTAIVTKDPSTIYFRSA